MNKKRNMFRYWYVSAVLVLLFLVGCSGGPLAGRAVATPQESDCPLLRDNAHLFTESDALLVNNQPGPIVLRQGDVATVTVGKNTIISPTLFVVKDCRVQQRALQPENSALDKDWLKSRDPERIGATVTFPTAEAGTSYLFAFGCAWVAGETAEESGWDCHGDENVESKFFWTTVTIESCTDGIKNGGETDVDCGGICGSTCILENSCQQNDDCQQGLTCADGQCISGCADGIKNGDESDTDCGGSCPEKCTVGKSCQVATDCQAELSCSAGQCQQPCQDGQLSAGETDVDCGGVCGSTCTSGKRCNPAATTPDCQVELSCGVSSTCTLFCTDGRLNNGETDIDCGGSCGSTCIADKSCQQNSDCQQGLQCNAQKKCATPPAPPPVQAAAPAAPTVKTAQKRPPRFWATGVTSKDQQIVLSEDGGKTFKVVYSATGKSSLRAITFPGKKDGLAVGPGGKILKTTDGGTSWVALNSGTTANLFGADCPDTQTCVVVGGKGTILKTVDGGQTWVAQASNTDQELLDVFFIDAEQGWAVGGRRYILHTTDGGLSWERQDTSWGLSYKEIQCIDINCWAVSSGIVDNANVELIQTWDGGVSWQMVSLPQPKDVYSRVNAIQVVTLDTGYACGSRGRCLKTTDGGLSWQALPGFDARWSANAVFFIDENVGCVAGYTGGRSGRNFCTSDGGTTWTPWGEKTDFNFFYGITGRP